MKVLIVNAMDPFIWGGAEELAFHLKKNIEIAGHQAEIMRIPFQWNPAERIPSQMMMVRAFELHNVDKVIGLKFPAYLINHPNKTLWLLHQFRQAYDLYDLNETHLKCGHGEAIRALIKAADQQAFSECNKIYTNSTTTQQRLYHYNGVKSKVLTPPINDPEYFTGGSAGNYIFAGGRINRMKRQYMLVEALVQTHSTVKLVIAGPADTEEDVVTLRTLIRKNRLEGRVILDIRFLPRNVYADYVNNAAAVASLPLDEDSMSYVAMEAAIASKPILTRYDSGGVLELVKDKATGWVAGDDTASLAAAMENVFRHPQLTLQYGRAAKVLWESFGVNWKNTVEALLR